MKEASGDVNVSQIQVSWEKEVVWLITAYFPNSLKETVATTRAVDAMLCQKHGARIILAGDFNSTETTSRSSTGGHIRCLQPQNRESCLCAATFGQVETEGRLADTGEPA